MVIYSSSLDGEKDLNSTDGRGGGTSQEEHRSEKSLEHKLFLPLSLLESSRCSSLESRI